MDKIFGVERKCNDSTPVVCALIVLNAVRAHVDTY